MLPAFIPHRRYRKAIQDRITDLAEQNPAMRADIDAHGDVIGFFCALDRSSRRR